ncbi:MAG: hypothetical protein Q9160_004196 [Pyrenula sp. 1 TL-2023]
MTAVSQIFTFLPLGIAYGLDVNRKNVVMSNLAPYDNSKKTRYIATVAKAYIDSDLVDSLNLALHTRRSELYHHNNPSVRTLMSYIDPSIPLLGGLTLDGAGVPNSNTQTGGNNSEENNNNSGAPLSGDQDNHNVRPSSVGVAVGVVCGAAIYGAAMFLVARRYRRRRNAHQRSSSMINTDDMRQREGAGVMTALMSGGGEGYRSTTPNQSGGTGGGRGSRNSRGSGRSGSARTQFISAPVMAENSLGWN